MKKSITSIFLVFVFLIVFLASACATAPTVPPPETPVPTSTPTLLPTQSVEEIMETSVQLACLMRPAIFPNIGISAPQSAAAQLCSGPVALANGIELSEKWVARSPEDLRYVIDIQQGEDIVSGDKCGPYAPEGVNSSLSGDYVTITISVVDINLIDIRTGKVVNHISVEGPTTSCPQKIDAGSSFLSAGPVPPQKIQDAANDLLASQLAILATTTEISPTATLSVVSKQPIKIPACQKTWKEKKPNENTYVCLTYNLSEIIFLDSSNAQISLMDDTTGGYMIWIEELNGNLITIIEFNPPGSLQSPGELLPGLYQNIVDTISGVPGLASFGISNQSCERVQGSFEILENYSVEYTTHFAANFAVHCGIGDVTISGLVRYNSSIEP